MQIESIHLASCSTYFDTVGMTANRGWYRAAAQSTVMGGGRPGQASGGTVEQYCHLSCLRRRPRGRARTLEKWKGEGVCLKSKHPNPEVETVAPQSANSRLQHLPME